jgi:SAM-dependent methyltransferase
MRSCKARRAWIERLRPVWLGVLRPFDVTLQSPFVTPPPLESRHIKRCTLVANRELLARDVLKKGAVGVEVGTGRGHFARTLLDAAAPRELHVIDIDLRQLDSELLRSEIEARRVIPHEGDSAEVLASFPDGYFDWVYIDADHSYAGVKRDIAVAKRKVKSDGLLVLNDYTFWSPIELMEYGVIHAVNEFCRDEHWELRYFALHKLMYCDVALQRIELA